MKKIIIIGSRRRNSQEDYKLVYNEFKKWYEDGDIIVSGGCPKGGDRFAEIIANKMGMTENNNKLIIHKPIDPPKGSNYWKWVKSKYDRNTIIAKEVEGNSIIIACVSKDRTGGTEDTIKKIKRRKILISEKQIRIV